MPSSNQFQEALAGLMPETACPLVDRVRLTQRDIDIEMVVTTILGVNTTRPVWRAERPSVVTRAKIVAQAAVTVGTTDYFSFIADKRTALAPTVAVPFITASAIAAGFGSLVAFVEEDLATPNNMFSATVADRVFASGDWLWASITKTGGTGLISPILTVRLTIEEMSD